jgi:hypothetical protein
MKGMDMLKGWPFFPYINVMLSQFLNPFTVLAKKYRVLNLAILVGKKCDGLIGIESSSF